MDKQQQPNAADAREAEIKGLVGQLALYHVGVDLSAVQAIRLPQALVEALIEAGVLTADDIDRTLCALVKRDLSGLLQQARERAMAPARRASVRA